MKKEKPPAGFRRELVESSRHPAAPPCARHVTRVSETGSLPPLNGAVAEALPWPVPGAGPGT